MNSFFFFLSLCTFRCTLSQMDLQDMNCVVEMFLNWNISTELFKKVLRYVVPGAITPLYLPVKSLAA